MKEIEILRVSMDSRLFLFVFWFRPKRKRIDGEANEHLQSKE